MRFTAIRRTAAAAGAALVATTTAAVPLGATAAVSAGALACLETSGARSSEGATAKEPALYPAKDAKKYGVIKDYPRMANGSVRIRTVFHVISDTTPTPAEVARTESMIDAQMQVLNDSFSGRTASDVPSFDSPFRFDLVETTWTTNPAWHTVVPGKNERDMKRALHEGDSTTLNVYVADIGGGLLGWAYFPKGYNEGRDYIDGVVILDESMPGGVDPNTGLPWVYGHGDTLTHEVGHWMMLEHTFAGGCSASGDGVADTPREAVPQFDCDLTADTCAAPGLDPVRNFMDYTEDSCMDHFTPGQVERMNDAWIQFRAGGDGGTP